MTKLLAVLTACLLGALALLVARGRPTWLRALWLAAFALLAGGGAASTSAHALVAKWGFLGDQPRNGLAFLVEGTAHRPFVYRRLAPAVVGWATDHVLAARPEVATRLSESSPLARYRAPGEEWTPRTAVAFHVAYALVASALFGTVLACAGLLHAVRPRSPIESIAAGALAVLLFPLSLVHGGYLYDATELLLWTVTLLCALRGPLLALPALVGLALVNKESAVVVIPALLPLLARRVGWRPALAWVGALGALGAAWVAWVRARYAGNPGLATEWWLPLNFWFWLRPRSYLGVDALFAPGLPAPRGLNLVLLLFVLVPARFAWPVLRADVRAASLLAAAALLPLFLLFTFTDEIRNLSLLMPFALVFVVEGAHALGRAADPEAARAEPAPGADLARRRA